MIKLTNKQNEVFKIKLVQTTKLPAIDINPIDEYDGIDTKYHAVKKTKSVSQTHVDDFTLSDDEHPDRFSTVCVIVDDINMVERMLIRDHFKKELILLPMANLSSDFVGGRVITIGYILIGIIDGDMTKTSKVVPKYLQMTNSYLNIDSRVVSYDAGYYDTSNKDTELAVCCLGKVEDLFGSCRMEITSLVPTAISVKPQTSNYNFTSLKNCQNVLIPIKFS